MAVSVSNPSPTNDDVWGRHPVKVVTVTFDASYAGSGGEAFDPAAYGHSLGDPIFVLVSPHGAATRGYVVHYDPDNAKLIVFEQTDPADAGGANVPLVEVDAATDLSALVVDVLIVW